MPLIEHPNPKKLSVVMIVRNEVANIEDALRSFIPFADEIIVNDTGSTDGTQNIVKSIHENVKLIESKWEDDFSAARNMACDYASNGWLLWLDADDRVPLDMVTAFLKLKTAPLDRCFQFVIRNTINGHPLGAHFLQLRMWPNHKDLRFRGRIHEQLCHSCLEMGLPEISTAVEIYHTGYDNRDLQIQKSKRNLALMEKVGYGEGNETEAAAVASTYFQLEQWKEGIERYIRIFEKGKKEKLNQHVDFVVPAMIGRGYYRLREYATALEWYEVCDPTNIEAMYEKGQVLELTGDFEGALKCYIKVIDMPEIIWCQAQDYDYCRMHAFHLAWRVMLSLGMKKEALNTLAHMHELYPKFKIVAEGMDA